VYKDGGQEKVPLPCRVSGTARWCAPLGLDGQTLLLYNPTVTVVSKRPSGDSTATVVHEDRDRRLLVLITPTLIDLPATRFTRRTTCLRPQLHPAQPK